MVDTREKYSTLLCSYYGNKAKFSTVVVLGFIQGELRDGWWDSHIYIHTHQPFHARVFCLVDWNQPLDYWNGTPDYTVMQSGSLKSAPYSVETVKIVECFLTLFVLW